MSKIVEPEDAQKVRDEHLELSKQWKEVLKPTNDEKVIVFPKGKIIWEDHPKWPGSRRPSLIIPIGPLESIFAMYHWYLFLGRHLLREEILELTNDLFPGMRIKSTTFFDKIKDPKDSVRKVLESLDDENRHHLELRCDRWFKDYLRRNPPASKRARYLVGFPGRVGSLKVTFPSIGGRPVESWKACIHYGVLNSSTDHENRPLETNKAVQVLTYHYNDGPDAHHTLRRSTNNFSSMLDDKNHKITKELVPLYRKHEHIWVDRAQNMVHEYEYEIDGMEPRKIKGRSLEVPFELRSLLGLKHSHITMDSSYSGWFSKIFEPFQDPEKEQSSFQGQITDPRSQQQYLPDVLDHPYKLAPIYSENIPPVQPDPKTVRDFAGPSTQTSAAGSYQLHDPNDLSQWRQGMQQVPPDRSLRAGYQQPHHAPSPYDPVSAVTTGIENLSVAAPAPAPGQDQGGVTGKRKKHYRSRTPPKERRREKRQTGQEARDELPLLASQQGRKKDERR